MKLPKTLYLDMTTWRCGGESQSEENTTGKGRTSLLNRDGYSCCLGQWIRQTDTTLDIFKRDCPTDVPNCNIRTLIKNNVDTEFGQVCMKINDNQQTSIKEKITKLCQILKKYRRRLVVRK